MAKKLSPMAQVGQQAYRSITKLENGLDHVWDSFHSHFPHKSQPKVGPVENVVRQAQARNRETTRAINAAGRKGR